MRTLKTFVIALVVIGFVTTGNPAWAKSHHRKHRRHAVVYNGRVYNAGYAPAVTYRRSYYDGYNTPYYGYGNSPYYNSGYNNSGYYNSGYGSYGSPYRSYYRSGYYGRPYYGGSGITLSFGGGY